MTCEACTNRATRAAFAPRFACMLPALFTCMPFAKSPRFPGDPWATFPHSPTWHWMHASTCALGSGAYAGSCTSRRMRFAPRAREMASGPVWESGGAMQLAAAAAAAAARPLGQREMFAEARA